MKNKGEIKSQKASIRFIGQLVILTKENIINEDFDFLNHYVQYTKTWRNFVKDKEHEKQLDKRDGSRPHFSHPIYPPPLISLGKSILFLGKW